VTGQAIPSVSPQMMKTEMKTFLEQLILVKES